MSERTDQAREGYQKFAEGDIEGATEPWADDFVLEGPNSEELPTGGEHKGKEEAGKKLQEAVQVWDEFELTTDEFLEEGDTIVVLGHQQVKKGDESAKIPFVHIWRWEGDEVKRLQLLTDTFWAAQMLDKA